MEQIEIFGWMVYPYSLTVTLAGALLCLGWGAARACRTGLSARAAAWGAVLGGLLAAVLARVTSCLCDWEWLTMEGVGYFVSFGDGGWMPVGALLGLALGLALAARLGRASFGKLADAFAAPFLLFAALCHVADGLAGEGFGWGVDDWLAPDGGMSLVAMEDASFFHRLPFAVGNYYGEWRWAVFVLMALVLLALCRVVCRRRDMREGGTACLAALLYACATVLGESLRQDTMIKWGFVRCAQLLCALVVLALLILCAARSGARGGDLIKSAALTFGGALIVIAMEFALEGKIGAIEWMTMDVCYCFTTLGCVLMALGVGRLWKRAFAKG